MDELSLLTKGSDVCVSRDQRHTFDQDCDETDSWPFFLNSPNLPDLPTSMNQKTSVGGLQSSIPQENRRSPRIKDSTIHVKINLSSVPVTRQESGEHNGEEVILPPSATIIRNQSYTPVHIYSPRTQANIRKCTLNDDTSDDDSGHASDTDYTSISDYNPSSPDSSLGGDMSDAAAAIVFHNLLSRFSVCSSVYRTDTNIHIPYSAGISNQRQMLRHVVTHSGAEEDEGMRHHRSWKEGYEVGVDGRFGRVHTGVSCQEDGSGSHMIPRTTRQKGKSRKAEVPRQKGAGIGSLTRPDTSTRLQKQRQYLSYTDTTGTRLPTDGGRGMGGPSLPCKVWRGRLTRPRLRTSTGSISRSKRRSSQDVTRYEKRALWIHGAVSPSEAIPSYGSCLTVPSLAPPSPVAATPPCTGAVGKKMTSQCPRIVPTRRTPLVMSPRGQELTPGGRVFTARQKVSMLPSLEQHYSAISRGKLLAH